MSKVVYLACPYSSDDPKVIHDRFIKSWQACIWGWKNGYLVFSPIAYTHVIGILSPNVTYDDWMKFDMKLLSVCDELWVLALPGWEDSKGVTKETEEAKRLGKPIRYFYLELIDKNDEPETWEDICAAVENYFSSEKGEESAEV